MSDPALRGNCLSCGKPSYAQSHCDSCAEGGDIECLGCGEYFKSDNYEDGLSSCYQHLSTVEELREECFHKVRDIKALYKRLQERDEKIADLEQDNAYLKKGWEIKDARTHDLETRLADMTRLVELGIKLDELRREEK